MDLSAVQTPIAGLLAGLVTSIHCVGMCGPLACAILPGGETGSRGSPHAALGVYHAFRMLSYATIGLLAGALGAAVGHVFAFPPAALLPWAFVVLFLVFLLGWEKRLPLPEAVSRAAFRLRVRAGRWKLTTLGATLGALTPFLPCAPLYILFGVALFSGSAMAGALLLAAFAAGTVAPLWLVQSQFFRIRARLSPVALSRLQKAVAVIAIGILAWRAAAGDGFSPDAAITADSCPLH